MTVPTVALVNGTGYVFGIASDEIDINIREFTADVKPQFVETLGNKQNVTIVVAYGPMELDLSVEGEIKGSAGSATTSAPLAVLGTAFGAVNSTAYNGAPTTGIYLEGANIKSSRSAFKSGTWTFKARGGVP